MRCCVTRVMRRAKGTDPPRRLRNDGDWPKDTIKHLLPCWKLTKRHMTLSYPLCPSNNFLKIYGNLYLILRTFVALLGFVKTLSTLRFFLTFTFSSCHKRKISMGSSTFWSTITIFPLPQSDVSVTKMIDGRVKFYQISTLPYSCGWSQWFLGSLIPLNYHYD